MTYRLKQNGMSYQLGNMDFVVDDHVDIPLIGNDTFNTDQDWSITSLTIKSFGKNNSKKKGRFGVRPFSMNKINFKFGS